MPSARPLAVPRREVPTTPGWAAGRHAPRLPGRPCGSPSPTRTPASGPGATSRSSRRCQPTPKESRCRPGHTGDARAAASCAATPPGSSGRPTAVAATRARPNPVPSCTTSARSRRQRTTRTTTTPPPLTRCSTPAAALVAAGTDRPPARADRALRRPVRTKPRGAGAHRHPARPEDAAADVLGGLPHRAGRHRRRLSVRGLLAQRSSTASRLQHLDGRRTRAGDQQTCRGTSAVLRERRLASSAVDADSLAEKEVAVVEQAWQDLVSFLPPLSVVLAALPRQSASIEGEISWFQTQ